MIKVTDVIFFAFPSLLFVKKLLYPNNKQRRNESQEGGVFLCLFAVLFLVPRVKIVLPLFVLSIDWVFPLFSTLLPVSLLEPVV